MREEYTPESILKEYTKINSDDSLTPLQIDFQVLNALNDGINLNEKDTIIYSLLIRAENILRRKLGLPLIFRK